MVRNAASCGHSRAISIMFARHPVACFFRQAGCLHYAPSRLSGQVFIATGLPEQLEERYGGRPRHTPCHHHSLEIRFEIVPSPLEVKDSMDAPVPKIRPTAEKPLRKPIRS